MDISAFGTLMLFLTPFWPAVVSGLFAALKKSHQTEFFIASVIIGYVSFVFGFLSNYVLSKLARGVVDMFYSNIISENLYVFFPIWLPVISIILFWIYFEKLFIFFETSK